MPTTKYVWDEDNLLYETDGDDVVTVEYTYSPGQYGQLISERRNGTTFTHHYDAQGSTVALTNDAGTVTDTFLYNAWGEEVARTGTTPTPFRWIGALGYYWDIERQMFYVRRRDYSGPLGRWLQDDPLGFAAGDTNLTRYATNNVPNNSDPSGYVGSTIFSGNAGLGVTPQAIFIPVILGGWLASKLICVYQYNQALDTYTDKPFPIFADPDQTKCLGKAKGIILKVDPSFDCPTNNWPPFIRTKGGNFTMTVYHWYCGCYIFFAPTDIKCNTCDGFVNTIATVYHECDHCKGSVHPKTYCTEAKFLEKLLPLCDPGFGPCADGDECKKAVNKYLDIAKKECKEGKKGDV